MDKVAWFVVTIAVTIVALALVNALAGYTNDNLAGWVIQRVR